MNVAVERRRTILASLSRFTTIDPHIVAAVDGRSLEIDRKRSMTSSRTTIYLHAGRPSITDGEIGCALSHLTCIRQFASSGDRIGLFLEDDALLNESFGRVVNSISSFFSESRRPSVCLLSARSWIYGRPLLSFNDGAVYQSCGGIGAYAYLMNAEGANRMLSTALPLVAPFDAWCWHRRHGIRLYSVVPHPASFIGDGDDSSLRTDRNAALAAAQDWKMRLPVVVRKLDRLLDLQTIYRLPFKLFLRSHYCPRHWPQMGP